MSFLPSHPQASAKSAQQQHIEVLPLAIPCALSKRSHSLQLNSLQLNSLQLNLLQLNSLQLNSRASTNGFGPCSFSLEHMRANAPIAPSIRTLSSPHRLLAWLAVCLALDIARGAQGTGGPVLNSRGSVPHVRGDGVCRRRQARGPAAEGGARGATNGPPTPAYPRGTRGHAVETGGGAGGG